MLKIIIASIFLGVLLIACGTDEPQVVVPDNKSSIEKRMDSIANEINRARELQEKTQLAEALMIAEAMLKRYPGQLDALTIKAEILKAQGKVNESIAVLEKAYALQPRDKELAYDLAYAYADAKNPKALSLTDTLLKRDKTETVARAWYSKATYYKNLGNTTETLRYLDSTTVADFNFLDAYLDKGEIFYTQKKYETALKIFATGQKLSPATADFYFWVAKCQEAMGNKTDAKNNYDRAFILDKTMTEAKEASERL